MPAETTSKQQYRYLCAVATAFLQHQLASLRTRVCVVCVVKEMGGGERKRVRAKASSQARTNSTVAFFIASMTPHAIAYPPRHQMPCYLAILIHIHSHDRRRARVIPKPRYPPHPSSSSCSSSALPIASSCLLSGGAPHLERKLGNMDLGKRSPVAKVRLGAGHEALSVPVGRDLLLRRRSEKCAQALVRMNLILVPRGR